jgi:hypothetical protein
VVTNDFRMEGRERIFVVTGPNQGGKTAFARTFGHCKLTANAPLPASYGEDLYYRLGGWLDEDKALPPAVAAATLDAETAL